VIETLTTGQMIPSETNSLPTEVSTQFVGRLLVLEGIIYPVVCFYHWVDTSVGRLLVSEGIICPVVSLRNTDYWADDTLED
jgi:hypothetical protein